MLTPGGNSPYFQQKQQTSYRLSGELEELGRLYAAYTDVDLDVTPTMDELNSQAIKVRELQRQLRELA